MDTRRKRSLPPDFDDGDSYHKPPEEKRISAADSVEDSDDTIILDADLTVEEEEGLMGPWPSPVFFPPDAKDDSEDEVPFFDARETENLFVQILEDEKDNDFVDAPGSPQTVRHGMSDEEGYVVVIVLGSPKSVLAVNKDEDDDHFWDAVEGKDPIRTGSEDEKDEDFVDAPGSPQYVRHVNRDEEGYVVEDGTGNPNCSPPS